MKLYLKERFPVRVPSINQAVFSGNAVMLRGFCRTVRPFLNQRFKNYERITVPAMVQCTAYFTEPRWAVDPDNLFVKPFVDSLAEWVLMDGHDGYKEVVEVRKRTRIGQLGILIEVYQSAACRLCHALEFPPTLNGRCVTCKEKRNG